MTTGFSHISLMTLSYFGRVEEESRSKNWKRKIGVSRGNFFEAFFFCKEEQRNRVRAVKKMELRKGFLGQREILHVCMLIGMIQ